MDLPYSAVFRPYGNSLCTGIEYRLAVSQDLSGLSARWKAALWRFTQMYVALAIGLRPLARYRPARPSRLLCIDRPHLEVGGPLASPEPVHNGWRVSILAPRSLGCGISPATESANP